MKKVIFMGTPIFACGILDALLVSDVEVVCVVSQPDKKIGRKQIITPTPLKAYAESKGIKVIQPVNIKLAYDELKVYEPDLIVTCAYGQIVPDSILELPTYGAINVHASLLPKLRGGAPIHKAIINGDTQSGVSIMRMVKRMDAGAVMSVAKVDIDPDDTMLMLHDKLIEAGAKLLISSLPKLFNGEAVFIEQDESKVTYAWNITREEELVHFSNPLGVIYNQMRGLIPNPISYGIISNKKIKFFSIHKNCATVSEAIGTLCYKNNELCIACDSGYIIIDELQLEGKNKCTAKEFYNGAGKNYIGKRFEV
ncbi:MAG: methionyl-tRNA formyltransferase [Erysipelotrichaceae bacterium]